MCDALQLIVACIVAALWKLLCHYLPWGWLIGSQLAARHTTQNLLYVSGILAGFAIYAAFSDTRYILALIAIALSTSVAVLIAHILDHIVETHVVLRAHDAIERSRHEET